ncbi:MAG TPA: hypothetical protein VNH53_03585 [Sphingomicrobium sp.]|jgi:hypothetical protein|nr:hypothetical protein [Sphingomicrobium sp.]
MSPILYWSLLIFTCGYAFYRGGRYERLVALVCLAGTVATITVNSPITERYVDVEGGALLVDSAVLAAFVAIALHSDRFWPLWVAGLQLTTSIAHFLKAMQPELVPQAYGVAVRFWSYPILIILIVGTWRAHQRRLSERSAVATS